MLAIERKNEILAILQKEQRVLVSELSRRYEVTDETIPAGIWKFGAGRVCKTHLRERCSIRIQIWICRRIREKTNRDEKQTIAALVSRTGGRRRSHYARRLIDIADDSQRAEKYE